MRVAIDVEGVLADIVGTWIYVYNHPFKKEEVTAYDFSNLSYKYGTDLQMFLWQTQFLWKMEIVHAEFEDMAGTIDRFHSYAKAVDIVTARPMRKEIETFLWQKKIKYDGLIVGDGEKMNKGKLGYDVYVDDHPSLYKKLKPNQTQIMITQPWNILVHHEQVKRAENLEHAWKIYRGLLESRRRDEEYGEPKRYPPL